MEIEEFTRLAGKHRAALTMDMHLASAQGAVAEVSQGWYEQWPASVRVYALRSLTEMRNAIDTLMDQLNQPAEESLQGRCKTPLRHPTTGTWPCVLPALHHRFEVDHMDEHGHTAPLLVSWSTIMEVRAVQAARERGEIT